MDYQALSLKNVKSDVSDKTIKVGVVTHGYPDFAAYDVKVIPLVDREGRLTGDYRVFVKPQGKERFLSAGHLWKQGVGRYNVASNHVEIAEGESITRRSEYQPRGYEHRGTVALCAERVVHEFLNSLEYAVEQAKA